LYFAACAAWATSALNSLASYLRIQSRDSLRNATCEFMQTRSAINSLFGELALEL
jgi:hypothetical protein